MFCYLLDLFVAAWRFEISTNATDYLRKLVSYNKEIDETKLQQFEQIYSLVRKRNLQLDFEREEKLEEKRDLKTNKYGTVEVVPKNRAPAVKQKRKPRNEIELEFFQQEEREKELIEKYRVEPELEEDSMLDKDMAAVINDRRKKPV